MTRTTTDRVPSLADWEVLATKELKGSPTALVTTVCSGVRIPALATAEDLAGLPHLGELPGCAPFVRGGEALQAPFALPLHLHSPDDLGVIGLDAPLGRSMLHLGPAFGTPVALAALVAEARRRGVDPRHLRATIECDPFAELAGGKLAEADFERRLAELAALLRAISQDTPLVRGMLVQSRWTQHRGADLVLESAIALTAGVALLRGLEHHGIAPDLAAAHLAFRFAVTTDVPAEIARLRIVRGLWAKIGRAFGVLHKSTLQMHLEAETSAVTSTTLDPHTNLIRSTLQAFAAASAGCETLTVLPFDARLHQWSELAVRIAHNQQRLLEHEAHLDRTADPFGGSYAIEVLTDRLGRAIWSEVQRIEGEGGLLAALKGPLAARLATALAERQRALAAGEEVLVGSNKFPPSDGARTPARETATWHAEDSIATEGNR